MNNLRTPYRDGTFVVFSHPEAEGHFLGIGQKVYSLPGGKIEEFVKIPLIDLEGRLDSFNPEIMQNVRKKGLTSLNLAYVFCRTRIVELEEESKPNNL